MKVLLDTHTFLWFAEGNSSDLSKTALETLLNPNYKLVLSIATLWEMAIKVRINKLPLTMPFEEFITMFVLETDVEILPILPEDTMTIASLPLFHRDPFDRIIIAQSMRLALPILSKDEIIDEYGVQRLW